MYDVKDLFSPARRRLLHGDSEDLLPEPPVGPQLPATWRAFPDPAVKAQWHRKTTEAMERLQSCQSSLQLCYRDISGSRHSLRQCRNLLEAHQASSLAICELLTDWVTFGTAARPKGSHCNAQRRCFFCRERRALEETVRFSEPMDSAALADCSGCSSSSSSEMSEKVLDIAPSKSRTVQRRKTSRERGQKLFKRRAPAGRPTWYATHTVDPPRSVGAAEPEVKPCLGEVPEPATGPDRPSETAPVRPKPVELLEDAELEPYASAAARFRAEMEFLDMSSFPASPEVKFRRRSSGEAFLDKTGRPSLVIDVEMEVVGPPAPPPSTSHSMLQTQLERLEARPDPLRGWRQLLVKTGLMARRARRSSYIKLMVLRAWQSCRSQNGRRSAVAVHQPITLAVRRPSKAVSLASSQPGGAD